MILVAFRHGSRVAALCALRWDWLNFKQGLLHVRRIKNGIDSVHPVRGPELRASRKLERETETSPYLSVTERGGPVTTSGFRKTLFRIGEKSIIGFLVHPHMLRHACGFKLANEVLPWTQEYSAHRSVYRVDAGTIPRLIAGLKNYEQSAAYRLTAGLLGSPLHPTFR